MARILVIDDEASIRRLLTEVLGAEGHTVIAAASATAAAPHLAAADIDLLITDMMMPDKDGLELLMELRRDHSHLRVIAISGGGQIAWSDVLQVARSLGAWRTIAKPFDLDHMVETVREALDRAA